MSTSDELNDLYVRRNFCDYIIRELSQMDDPRAPSALEHYRGELKELDGKITELEQVQRRERGVPEPEPVVVGLKPATLFGKAKP